MFRSSSNLGTLRTWIARLFFSEEQYNYLLASSLLAKGGISDLVAISSIPKTDAHALEFKSNKRGLTITHQRRFLRPTIIRLSCVSEPILIKEDSTRVFDIEGSLENSHSLFVNLRNVSLMRPKPTCTRINLPPRREDVDICEITLI